jgi:hypothetical protein
MPGDIQAEIQSWINSLGTVTIACGVVYNAWRTRQLEKNTNSIKDALVESTRKASHLEGREEARSEGADANLAAREAVKVAAADAANAVQVAAVDAATAVKVAASDAVAAVKVAAVDAAAAAAAVDQPKPVVS